MKQFINLTPHAITILNDGGSSVVIPPSGTVARVATTSRKIGSVGGVDFFAQETGETYDLPAPVDGTIFIVSALVRLAHPERHDVASPGELVRNETGQPIGCRGLVVNR